MRHLVFLLCVGVLSLTSSASWYWPFGSDDDGSREMRLSELMEPATELIDEASDLASEGKVQESVEKYRKALEELDRIEAENPERAQKQEFATVRNKRAYVNAAIDAMLMSQVKQNARAVAVSDTTALEQKLKAERAAKSGKKPSESVKPPETNAVPIVKAELPPVEAAKPKTPTRPATNETRPATGKDRVAYDLAKGDYADAEAVISEMLVKTPNDPTALNLKAAMEMSRNQPKAAEAALDQAIMSNPRSHYAYYNMALLLIRVNPENKRAAKRYYETGRAVGGPEDAELEELVK